MIQMYINDEEVVSNKDFTIVEEMLATSSTILNNCYPKTWEEDHDYVSRFYYPKDYSLCKILKDNALIFAGCVKNSGNISLRPQDPKYCALQILNFKTFLSEGETLDFVISNKTINEAIEMVVNAISDYGVVLGNINILNGNDIIGAYSTLNKTAYDVFQYLSDISQSRWSTRTIDVNTIAVDFYDPSLMPRGINIDYTDEWFETNVISGLSFSYGTRDYRNKQVMLSKEVYADIDYDETLIANGFDRTFSTINSIGVMKSIVINGENLSFATNSDKEIGIQADFYYTPGTNQIQQNESNNIVEGGTQIIVSYTPLVQGRQIVYNYDEVNRITNQLGRKGVIARYEDRNDVLSSDELRKVGQSYIKYKGTAEIKLNVVSQVNLWEVGQIVYFDAPIDELKQDYMVKKKSIQIIASVENVFYTYELSSNFNSESAINYFDNQRSKTTGNISSGEFITRNIDIESSAMIIFKNLNITEEPIIGDNILDSTLNSPLTK
jgi:hypothetical protein